MSWAALKAQAEWNWGQAWRDVYEGIRDETQEETGEAMDALNQLDCLYAARDVRGFMRLVSELVNRPWWRGSKPIWVPSPSVASASSTAAPTTSENPTLWDATEGSTWPSNASKSGKSRHRSSRQRS